MYTLCIRAMFDPVTRFLIYEKNILQKQTIHFAKV